MDITISENSNNENNEDENEVVDFTDEENKILDSEKDDENINNNIDKNENEYLEFEETYPQKKKTKGKRTYLESIGEENELNKFMDKLKLDNLNDKKIKEN